jgi:PAS domain S-box-containing protein
MAVAVALDLNGNIRFIELSTLTNEECSNRTKEIYLEHPFIKKILDQRDNIVQNHISKDDYLPPLYFNPVESILAVPFHTSNQLFGFAYFVNKKDNTGFSEQDLILIDPLASQLSILYENIESYELVQNQAVHLQLESSKLKSAQVKLSQSEKMFRQFAENIKEVFWRTTSTMNEIIYISPGYDAIWGMPSETIYANPCSWQNAVLEEDRENINSALQKMLSEHENHSIQFRIKREDGEIRHIYNKSIFLKDEMGKIDHVIGIASDITKQIFMHKRVALEQELRSILEHSQSIAQVAFKTIKAICRIFEWELGEIWLMSDTDESLKNFRVWHSKNSKFDDYDKCTHKMKCDIDQDLAGKIWREAAPIWFKETTNMVEGARKVSIENLGMNHAIGFPILYHDDVLGVMNFYAQKISAPDKDFIDMLTMLGSRLGDFMHQYKMQKQMFDLANKGGWNSIF